MAKIQSISDIITNSSSEAFLVVDEELIDKYKKFIQDLLTALNINENIDDVLAIKPDIESSYHMEGIKHLILTGRYNKYAECAEDIENEVEDEDYFMADGYPLCDKEEDITDEMLLKAAMYFNEHSNAYEYCEGFPPIEGVIIEAKKPEYEAVANALDNIINSAQYLVTSC